MAVAVTRVGKLELSYDRDADVLYVSLGSPRPAVTDEAEGGLLIRRDPETRDIVGATVLEYEARFRHLSDFSWILGQPLPVELKNFLQEHPPPVQG